MKSKLPASLALLLLLFVFQSGAYAGARLNASQTGTGQAVQSNEQGAGFDNPMAVYQFRSEVTDLLSSGMLGFMLGAGIVVAQTLRRRALPASTGTIALNL